MNLCGSLYVATAFEVLYDAVECCLDAVDDLLLQFVHVNGRDVEFDLDGVGIGAEGFSGLIGLAVERSDDIRFWLAIFDALVVGAHKATNAIRPSIQSVAALRIV